MTHPTMPAACTLPPPDLGDRLAWIRAEILPHARDREALDGGVAWRFPADPVLRAKLEHLVELESRCCDPERVRFALAEEPDAAGLRLEVYGLDPDTTLLGAPNRAPRSGLGRLARAGGLGTAGAFVLFCVAPMALAGAGLAAPLARLESPAVLAAGSLAFAALAFWWLRRREARRSC